VPIELACGRHDARDAGGDADADARVTRWSRRPDRAVTTGLSRGLRNGVLMSQFTIERLKTLRPGQQLVYYRGNFEHDIERSNEDASTYGEILMHVRDTASSLAREGKIRLIERPYGAGRFRLFEYVAFGVAPAAHHPRASPSVPQAP
jgi:hypothetical protein